MDQTKLNMGFFGTQGQVTPSVSEQSVSCWNLNASKILSGLRFVQEIKVISKYRDCLKILRIVICKHKD